MRHSVSRGTSSQEDNSSVPTEPEPAAKVTGRPQSSQEPGRKPAGMERCVKKQRSQFAESGRTLATLFWSSFLSAPPPLASGKKEADAGCG